MKAGSFTINGVSSEDSKTVIQSRPILHAPKRKVDFKEAYGHDGSIPYDENSYENTKLELLMYSDDGSATDTRAEMYNIFNSPGYIDLVMYADPTKIYKVMLDSPHKFESRYYMKEGVAFEIGLTVKPYKYLVTSPKRTLTTSGNLFNPTLYTSLPVIKIFGSGTITLKVNEIDFMIKNISDHIILDSETMYGYKETGSILESQNGNIYTRNFPFLKPGNNTISWTGTVTRVEIEPKWRTLT